MVDLDKILTQSDYICDGIADRVIQAGIDAKDRTEHDLKNYISGVTPDWDDGMIVAFIWKAMWAEMKQARIDALDPKSLAGILHAAGVR